MLEHKEEMHRESVCVPTPFGETRRNRKKLLGAISGPLTPFFCAHKVTKMFNPSRGKQDETREKKG